MSKDYSLGGAGEEAKAAEAPADTLLTLSCGHILEVSDWLADIYVELRNGYAPCLMCPDHVLREITNRRYIGK